VKSFLAEKSSYGKRARFRASNDYKANLVRTSGEQWTESIFRLSGRIQ
jgi:hypothetical protein